MEDPAPTPEQIPEEGGDKVTGVTKSGESQPDGQPAAAVFHTEPPKPETDPNAAVTSENAVSIEFVGKDLDAPDGESAPDAESIAYLENVKGYDGNRTTSGNVVFRAKAKPGWTALDGTSVTATYPAEGSDTPASVAYDDGVYTISTNKGDGFIADLTVAIKAHKVKNTLIKGAGTSEQMYLVGTVGEGENQKVNPEITTSTGVTGLPFETFFSTESDAIRIAVPKDDAGTNKKIAVKIADQANATEFAREGSENIKLNGTGDAVECVIFAFKAADVDDAKYDATVNTDANYTVAMVNTLGGSTLKVDKSELAGCTIGVVAADKVEPSEDFEFKAVNLSTDTILSLTKDDYRMTLQKKNVVVFKLTANTGKKITKVYAELNTEDEPAEVALQKINAKDLIYNTDTTPAKAACYGIDLFEIDDSLFTANMTLKIKADVEYISEDDNKDAFANHKIEFTGDLDTVVIKASKTYTDNSTFNSESALKNPLETEADDFDFAIQLKPGYEFSKGTDYNSGGTSDKKVVTVSYDKVYSFTVGGAAPKAGTYYVRDTKRYEEEKQIEHAVANNIDRAFDLGAVGNANADATKFTIKQADTSTDINSGKLKDLALAQNPSLVASDLPAKSTEVSYKNIKIDIKTELEKEKSGTVRVGMQDHTNDMSYDITGEGITRINETNDWRIDWDAELLTLNIASEVKPGVKYEKNGHAADATGAAKYDDAEVTGSAGAYTAKIPVSRLYDELMEDGVTSIINAEILISKDSKSITVIDGETGSTPFAGDILVKGPENTVTTYDERSAYSAAESIVDGTEVTVTLYAKAGTLFDKAYYILKGDKEKTKHDLDVNAEKTEASFTLKMTDDVEVRTTKTDVFRYVVQYSDGGTVEAKDAGDGIYPIPAGVTSVTITAYKGDAAQPLYSVKAYDGGSLADCVPSISGNAANLTLSKKDGELLRLELKGYKFTNSNTIISLPSISLRQDKLADEIVIRDSDGNPVDSVTLLPDGEEHKFNVEVVSGSLNDYFLNGNIALEIARDASRAGQKASSTVTSDKIEVEYDGINAVYDTKKKTLTIKGLQARKGNDNPVTLRFYDVKRRNNAVNKNEEDKLCVLKGSEISVKLDSPAIALVTPAVKANNTVHNLQLSLSASEFNPVKATWYRIKIAEKVYPLFDRNADTIINGDDLTENDVWMATPYDNGNYVSSDGREIWVRKAEWDGQEIRIPVYYELKDGKLLEKSNKYNLTIDLVQSIKNSTTPWSESETDLIASPAAKFPTETAEAVYPTDLTLDKTTATVYTGNGYQKVATATLINANNAKGVRQIKTSFVNAKTGAAADVDNAANSRRYDVDGVLECYADLDGNIIVNAEGMRANKTLPKDLGLKVSTYAKDAGEISKIITLKFVNGVDSDGIRFENGDNRILYRQDGKKATLKLKAVVNENSGVKAKNQKLITYVLGDRNGREEWENGYEKLSANLQGSVTVNAKNGTVTVSKDYVYKQGDDAFSVIARVAGTSITTSVRITIKQEAQTMGGIVIVDAGGNVVARDGGTLKAEDFLNNKQLYVRALKSDRPQSNNKYENPYAGVVGNYGDYMEGISFTSGNKKSLAISKTTGRLTMAGASGKAVKITAVNTDGSKKVANSITVNVTGPKNLGLRINDSGNSAVFNAGQGTTYRYSGALKEKFVIYPQVRSNVGWEDVGGDYYKNLKITVKGAKKTEQKDAFGNRWFELVKSAPVTTITISDKTDKTVAPVTYTIEQSPATPVKGKALKIKTVTKLTESMLDSARTAEDEDLGTIEIKFQIAGKDAGNYAGSVVMLTPDYSNKKLFNKIEGTEEYRRANSYFLGDDGEELRPIDENGCFTIPLEMWRRAAQERIPGTYKLVAAIGQYGAGGQFVFEEGLKSTTVSVKIPGKAPKKLGIEAKGDYTLSTGGGRVLLETGISSAYRWNVTNNDPNLAKNVVSADGTINRFRDYFKVSWDDGRYWLSMKDDINLNELKALLKDTEGKDRKGFVTVNSFINGVGIVETKDVLINVNLVQTGVLNAKAKDTFRGAKAAVRIYGAEGSTTPLELYSAALDTTATAQTDVKVLGLKKDANNKDTIVEVEISKKAGDSVSFDLKVLTANSAFANATPTAPKTTAYVQENGDKVPVTINLADPSTATDTVSVLTKEEDLTFRALVDKTGYDSDYAKAADKREYNSYFETGSTKKYVLRVDVESTIEGAEVSSAVLDKTTADATVQSIVKAEKGKKNNEILITLDHKKFLQECAKEGASVEKGGTIEVPVTVKFTPSEIKDQTIRLNLTLPSPKTYEEAKAAMMAAQSGIESLQPDEYLLPNSEGVIETATANLQEKIRKALREAVPLDAEAILDPASITLDNAADGKFKKTVLVKEKSTKQDKDYSREFVWDVPGDTKWTADGIIAEITTLLAANGTNSGDKGKWLEDEINKLDSNKNAGKIVNNSYTGDDFLKDLTAMLKKKNIEAGKNIVLAVDYKVTKRATNSGDGYVTITIKAKDAENKADSFELHKTETALHISPILNLKQEGEAVEAALTNEKFDYKQKIYDALNEATDIDGLETVLREKIRAAAKDALTNKSIAVEFKPLDTVSGENNSDTVKNNVDVRFKLPDSAPTSGYVKYHLLLKLDGAKDYEINYTTDSDDFDLAVGDVVKNGKTFQTLEGLGGGAGAFNSQVYDDSSNIDGVLHETNGWTAGAASALDKAVFKDKIDVKNVVDKKAKVQAKVKALTEKVVNGMFLDVDVQVDNIAGNDTKAAGKVTVTDKKKRKKNGDAYTYVFAYEINFTAASNDAESLLDDPSLVSKGAWDGEIKTAMTANQPDWECVSGLTVGKPEKIDDHTYRVSLGGTLKYVENWTGFSSNEDEQSGYYAAISVPIPKDLKMITDNSTNAGTNYIQVAEDIERRFNGSTIKAENGTWTHVQRMTPKDDHSQIEKGSISDVSGFKIVVDYDGLTGSDGSIATGQTGSTTDYKTVTYIFDASAVKLDNTSEAEISFGATDADITAIKSKFGVTAANDAFLLTGENDGKSDVIKASGSLKMITASNFNGTHTEENKGYYAVVTVKAPKNVKTTGSGATTAGQDTNATLKTYNPAVYGDADHKKTLKFKSVSSHEDQFDSIAILLRVNDESVNFDKRSITFTVDWDGDSNENWSEKKYTLDLSNVIYEKAQ